MNNAIFTFDRPQNEPILSYLSGSPERERLINEISRLSSNPVEIPLIIGGKEIKTGKTGTLTMPHDHRKILAIYHQATANEIRMAIDESQKAKQQWESISWIERSSIMLRAAELLSGKYRAQIVASTMLGQNKNAYQAEIDAACEVIDYLRYNIYFAGQN